MAQCVAAVEGVVEAGPSVKKGVKMVDVSMMCLVLLGGVWGAIVKWSSIHYEYAHTVVKSIVNVLVECLRSAERSSSGAFPFFFLRAMSANGTLDGFGHDGIPGHESTRKFELRRRAVGIWRRGMCARPLHPACLR